MIPRFPQCASVFPRNPAVLSGAANWSVASRHNGIVCHGLPSTTIADNRIRQAVLKRLIYSEFNGCFANGSHSRFFFSVCCG